MLLKLSRVSVCVVGLGMIATACVKPSSNAPKVYGGEENKDKLPMTVRVDVTTKNNGMRTCAGAFISDSVLLTSALCLDEAKEVTIFSDLEPFKSKKPKSKEFKFHPEFKASVAKTTDEEGKNVEFKYVEPSQVWADIALVNFAKNTAPANMIAKFAKAEAKVNDEVILVGYGSNAANLGGLDVRRVGANKIAEIGEEDDKFVISVRGSEKDANDNAKESSLGAGDNGGPLYNKASEIIGIASTKVVTGKISYFANVAAKETRDFIFETAKIAAVEGEEKKEEAKVEHKAEVTCRDRALTVKFMDGDKPQTMNLSSCRAEVSCDKEKLNLKAAEEKKESGNGSSTSVSTSASRSLALSSEAVCKSVANEIKAKLP